MNFESLVQTSKNERWVVVANFVREVGMQAAYWIGVLGYAAYGFGGDAGTVMLVMLMLNISGMFGNIIGGGIVDSVGPRKTVLGSSLFVIAACIAALFVQGNVIAFVAFAAFFGLATTILNTGYTSFAPYLEKGKAGLRRVNSFLTIGAFIAVVIGPGLGAIVTGRLPVYSVFILMAIATVIGFIIMLRVVEKHSPASEHSEADIEDSNEALALGETPYSHTLEQETERELRSRGIKTTEPVRPTATSITAGPALVGRNASKRKVRKTGPISEAFEGWKIIRQTASLRYYLLVTIAIIVGFGAFDVLEPLFFYEVLQVEIHMMGWVMAIGGIGLLIGVMLLAVFPVKWINARLLALLSIICGIGSVAYVATVNMWWVGTGQLILGFAFGVFDPLLRTMVQADTPLKAVGRVLGTINMIVVGLLLIPLVAAPFLSEIFGVQQILITASALPIVLGLLLYPAGKSIDKEAQADGHRHIESVSAID